jgi:hypothetical protein
MGGAASGRPADADRCPRAAAVSGSRQRAKTAASGTATADVLATNVFRVLEKTAIRAVSLSRISSRITGRKLFSSKDLLNHLFTRSRRDAPRSDEA